MLTFAKASFTLAVAPALVILSDMRRRVAGSLTEAPTGRKEAAARAQQHGQIAKVCGFFCYVLVQENNGLVEELPQMTKSH